MDTIDSHMHINLACNASYYRDKRVDEYLNIMHNKGIDFFIPSINPKIITFTCDEDCSINCDILAASEEIVCPVDCKKRDRHRVKVMDSKDGELIAYCTKCKKIIYEGEDPFHKYNIELIELCKKLKVLPLLNLSISNSTINREVKFFEENYGDSFIGYKVHPTSCMRSIDDIDHIDSERTILIHTDVHEYDSIENAINFAKRYKGNVVLAHSYLLRDKSLIDGLDNIYFDICPTDNFIKSKDMIEHNKAFDESSDVYQAALQYLPEDRLLFGSDWPYGSVSNNKDILDNSNIDKNVKKKVLGMNARRAYHI